MISVCIKLIYAFIFCLTLVSAQKVSAQKSSPQTANDHVVHESANLRGVDAIRKYGNIAAVTTASLHDISEVPIDQCGRTLTTGLDQFIVTVAGTGQYGYNADEIAATRAEVYLPSGIKVDVQGNIYFADTLNNRVRKVTVKTGEITTIAGTGSGGYNKDRIASTDATLFNPYDVAFDGIGNVYIADTFNHRVRKVDAVTGLITTIAGTGDCGNYENYYGVLTQLCIPHGVAVDGFGHVYIADTGNGVIRVVTDDRIETVARLQNGYLDNPTSIALDGMGNIYIANKKDHFVGKYSMNFGQDIIIAGAGYPGYNGDNIKATAALLSSPSGIALDGAGNVYIADTGNQRVRKVTVSTGIITTIAGTQYGGYNGDNIVATTAQLANPYGVAVDRSGNVYITDYDNNRIRIVTSKVPTASPSTAPSTTPIASPSSAPSVSPTSCPSTAPSVSPTASPSSAPSTTPTASPSTAPSTTPTALPSTAPSMTPTASPSTAPSRTPTSCPSTAPSVAPTVVPDKKSPKTDAKKDSKTGSTFLI